MQLIKSCIWLVTLLVTCGLLPVRAAETNTPPPLLIRLGIEPNQSKEVARRFNAAANPDDLQKGVGHFVRETDRRLRERAAADGKSPQSIANFAGTAMEYSLLVALLQQGKKPLYWQAEFKEIPNNFYDVVFFTKEHGPVVLSPKTSLRERYKQADLEALALRGLFPKSQFYLLSLDPNKKHIANIQRKIASGEVRGILALYDETNLDELFQKLEPLTASEPAPGTLRSARRIPSGEK